VQSVQLLSPASDVLPAGQFEQSCDPATLVFPESQSWQTKVDAEAALVPAGQRLHMVAPAGTCVTCPPSVSFAWLVAKVPAGHAEQPVALGGEINPAPHGVQSSTDVE
jgi:hypothetical protein